MEIVASAALARASFGFWLTVTTFVSWRWRRGRKIIDGVPVVIVANGEPVRQALAVERIPIEEVLEAARMQGVDDLARIRLAVLEVSGRISIIAN